MTNPLRCSSLIWCIQLLAASATLALAVVLLLVVVASQSAQAQTYEVLHTFTGGADGGSPEARLVRDAAGNLYGTTSYGGSENCYDGRGQVGCGVVFKLSPTGKLTTLHAFTGGADGATPPLV